jgi:SAM-dependent methyltransferase
LFFDSSSLPHAINYDPLKAKLGRLISRNVPLRRLFYTALGMLFLRQWHVRAELKRITRERGNTIRGILDAGSGFGQYTYLMGKLFPWAHIFAVDVKDEQVSDCRWFAEQVGHKHTKFEVADLTRLHESERFNLALSVDVMEHIAEDEAVFANVFASLRPDGTFIVATPSATEEGTAHAGDEDFSVVGEHVRQGYTRQEFIDKITRAGFTVEKLRSTYGPVWGRLAWLLLQRIPMLLLSMSTLFVIVVVPWMVVMYLPAALFMWLDVHTRNNSGGGWLMIARKNV